MPNYSEGRIYGIYDNDRLLYVGSTTVSLAKRMANHKRDCKLEKPMPLYRYIKERGGWDDVYIELIEACPCSNSEELHRKEGEIIRSREPCCNKQIAGRSRQEYWLEYYEANKEHLSEINKNYYEANKEHLAEKRKKRYEINKETVLEKAKTYYQKRKEQSAKDATQEM